MERWYLSARRLAHVRPKLVALVLALIAIAVAAGVSVAAAEPNPFRWG